MRSDVAKESSRPAPKMPLHLSRLISVFLLFAVLICGIALLLRFGGYILFVKDPLPLHAEVAVMLAGGDSAEDARLVGALKMLQEGRVDHVMLSVGRAYFMGEWLPDLLRRYVDKTYGPEIAQKVVLCEVSNEVDSTAEEAAALRGCLVAHGWRSVIVVTSNYHTRRAQMIWRAAVAKMEPPFAISVQGVSDGDFEPQGWWRTRRYAKSWLLELTKLTWTCLFERKAG
jgi:uncharacterized SAM-binding protein YcdF (DUF218 family)